MRGHWKNRYPSSGIPREMERHTRCPTTHSLGLAGEFNEQSDPGHLENLRILEWPAVWLQLYVGLCCYSSTTEYLLFIKSRMPHYLFMIHKVVFVSQSTASIQL